MFSTNIKQKGREGRRLTSRRRAGGILVGGTFGLFALLWSGLIVYVGLAARAEIAPMDVLTCQVAVAGKPKAAIASGDQGSSRIKHPATESWRGWGAHCSRAIWL